MGQFVCVAVEKAVEFDKSAGPRCFVYDRHVSVVRRVNEWNDNRVWSAGIVIREQVTAGTVADP